jgi:hypothetical protein
VVNAAEALDRELFPPLRLTKPDDARIKSKQDGLLRVVMIASIAIVVVALMTWLRSRGHTPH